MRDKDVRAEVLRQLALEHDGDAETRIVEEMGIWAGSVRIDVAVINGELCGYELKSERDTLARLPFQVEIYGKVFDKLVLVAGSRHVAKAITYIPEWWGVKAATQHGDVLELSTLRAPETNPAPDPTIIAQLLWKEEALQILERLNMAKGMRSKRLKFIHEKLASDLSITDLCLHVRTALKARQNWLGQTVSHPLKVPVNANCDPIL